MMEKPLFDMDNEVWSVDDHDSWGRIVAIHPRTNGEWWYVVRATWAWDQCELSSRREFSPVPVVSHVQGTSTVPLPQHDIRPQA